MRLAWPFDLGHVPAVELEMLGVGKGIGDMLRERDRYELVSTSPHEQRIALQCLQPRPEAVIAVRLLEVDLTGRGVERGAAGGREISTKELVHAGSRPAFIRSGNQAMNNRLDQAPRRQLHEPELRPRQTEQRSPQPLAAPRQRWSQKRQTTDAVGLAEPDFQRDPPAETVADQ